jgi:hypothetical protein
VTGEPNHRARRTGNRRRKDNGFGKGVPAGVGRALSGWLRELREQQIRADTANLKLEGDLGQWRVRRDKRRSGHSEAGAHKIVVVWVDPLRERIGKGRKHLLSEETASVLVLANQADEQRPYQRVCLTKSPGLPVERAPLHKNKLVD